MKNFIIPEFSDINLYGEVDKNGTNLVKVQKGDQFKAGDVVIDVLSPSKKYENENNNSVLCKLTYKDFSMLLTGDIEKEVEELILEEGVDLDCDVLKVAHHGSDTSSTEEFIKAVSPEVAVVSVGKNNFGHPSMEVIERLKENGIRVFRTDESGTVTLKTNGENVSISEFNK